MSGSRDEYPDYLTEENIEAIEEEQNSRDSSGGSSNVGAETGASQETVGIVSGSDDSGGSSESSEPSTGTGGSSGGLGGDPAGSSGSPGGSSEPSEPSAGSDSGGSSNVGAETGASQETVGIVSGSDDSGGSSGSSDSSESSEPSTGTGGSSGGLGGDPAGDSENTTEQSSTSGSNADVGESSDMTTAPSTEQESGSEESGSLDPSETFTVENRQAIENDPGGGVPVEEGVELSDSELKERVASSTEGVSRDDLEVLDARDGRLVSFKDDGGGGSSGGSSGSSAADNFGLLPGSDGGGSATNGESVSVGPGGDISSIGLGGDGGGTAETPGEVDGSGLPAGANVSAGAGGLDLLSGSEASEAREEGAENINQQLEASGISVDVSAGDVQAVGTNGQAAVSLDDETEREVARESIRNQLEEETGADLGQGDITLQENPDGPGYIGRLSEEGQDSVEVQTTPGSDIPIVGGLTTTATRGRQAARDVTDPIAEPINNALPESDSVLGFLGAAAPAAAAEPTPLGEAGLAVVGGTALAGVAASEYGGAVTGDSPEADAAATGPGAVEELEVPEEERQSELLGGEETQTEIEVPEGEEQTIAPEELGVPREELQSGEREISGPEGTQVNDDGEIVVPAEATQVAKGNRFEDEEEESDEESDEEESDEEEEPLVPEELQRDSDETVVIGEPEGTESSESESSESEESEEAELLNPEQGTQSDDAEPEESEAEESDDLNVPVPGQGTQSDDAEPTDGRQEETEELVGGDGLLNTEQGSGSQLFGGFGVIGGAGGGSLFGGLLGNEEETGEPTLTAESEEAGLLEEFGEGDSAAEGDALELLRDAEAEETADGAEPEGILNLGEIQGQDSITNIQNQVQTTEGQATAQGQATIALRLFTQTGTTGGGDGGGRRLRRPRRDGEDPEQGLAALFGDAEEQETEGDSELTSGYLSEFASALSGTDRSAPEQEELSRIYEEEVVTDDSLPTEGALKSPDEFGEAAGLLGGEGSAVDGFGFSLGGDGDGLLGGESDGFGFEFGTDDENGGGLL